MRHLLPYQHQKGAAIVATPSAMLPLGTAAPPFSLHDVVSGRTCSVESFADQPALFVLLICSHCPDVVHVEHHPDRHAGDSRHPAVGTLAITSEDPVGYPDDRPPK